MRAVKAKNLKRRIYGEFSPRERKLVEMSRGQIVNTARIINVKSADGKILSMPIRRVYQLAKKLGYK